MIERPPVSRTAELVYRACGPALARGDGPDTGWAWLNLIAAACTGLDDVDDIVRDDQQGRPGWAVLFDVDLCPDRYLPVLAQFAGVRYDAGLNPAANRARIRSRAGATDGTPEVVLAAVRATLTDGARVVATERDSSAYHGTVRTYASQTPDPAATQAAINAAKPAPVLIDLVVLTGPTFAEARAAKDGLTFAERQARFPTFGDVADYIPEG